LGRNTCDELHTHAKFCRKRRPGSSNQAPAPQDN
jgi:hypothetical protein